MKIITGRTGEPHVTSDDDRHLHAGTFGVDKYILETGSKLKATYSASNTIRIEKGDIIHQGTHSRIEDYEDIELSPGTSGYNRIDTICAQYKKVGGVEGVELVVYQGELTAGTPTAKTPTYESANILNGDDIADMALYQITFTGLDITNIKRVANIKHSLDSVWELVYPIGSIYMSVNNVNPSNLFGGVWEEWGNGRVPVGVSANDNNFNIAEKTGGQATTTLATNNMPAHSHSINDSGHTHTVTSADYSIPTTKNPSSGKVAVGTEIGYYAPTSSTQSNDWQYYSSLTADKNTTGITIKNAYGNSQGKADPISNLQPYITCYMWKRTA